MSDHAPDRLDRLIDDAALDYNAPPPTPREEMWAVIQRERQSPGHRQALRFSARRWTPWVVGLAAAATLAVGFGLGRLTDARPGAQPQTAAAAESSAEPSLPLRLAASGHLGEAEALLTMYRSAQREADRAALSQWARDLLSSTRTMLDSRMGEDPALALLLADLELVLAQIASAASESDTEQELIEEGMEQRQILDKLRTRAETPLSVKM